MKYKCTSDRCAINKRLASGDCGAFEPHLWSCAVPREATPSGKVEATKFDCNGNNAPAYSCNKLGDNSGEYVKAENYATLQHELAICMDALRGIAQEDIADDGSNYDIINIACVTLANIDALP